MVHGFGRSLVSLAVLVLAGGAGAQDSNATFKEAVRLLRLNKDAEARDKLREVLNADPSNEDAFKIWRETDQRIWQLMLEKDGDIRKMAQSLISRARIVRKPWAADPEKVSALVTKALGADYGERREATMALASEYGERGAAGFVDALGDTDNNDGQTYAIQALAAMGRSAVNPLLACLHSTNDTLRRNAAAALQYIGDPRSAADLRRLVEQDQNNNVKEVAAKALDRMGAKKGSAHDLYIKKVNDYLAGNSEVSERGDLREVIWSLKENKLVGTPVPPDVYESEMAKEAAYEALALNPSSDAGFVALTRSYLYELTAVREALAAKPDDEGMKAMAEGMADLGVTVLGAGPKYLRDAVAADLKLGMVPVAVTGIRLLPKVESSTNLESLPLQNALDHSDGRVQYAAALSLAEVDPNGQFSSREKVVDLLGRAVLEQSVRIVKFIDSDEKNRGLARAASSKDRGLVIDADSRSGIEGIESLRYFHNVDVVVINSNLKDITAQDVVREIRENPATANTKVILVTANKADDEKTFGDKVAYIEGPVTGENLKARIDEVLKDVQLPGPQKRADEISMKAAEALASLDQTRFDLGRVTDDLLKAAAREDKVAVPALRALGRGGRATALDAIIALAADESKSVPCRVAAAAAAGDVLGRTKDAPQKATEALTALAKSKADRAVREAAVAALGKAALAPGERAKILRELRVEPGVKAADAGATDATAGKEDAKKEGDKEKANNKN